MKQELVKPVVAEEAALEVDNDCLLYTSDNLLFWLIFPNHIIAAGAPKHKRQFPFPVKKEEESFFFSAFSLYT